MARASSSSSATDPSQPDASEANATMDAALRASVVKTMSRTLQNSEAEMKDKIDSIKNAIKELVLSAHGVKLFYRSLGSGGDSSSSNHADTERTQIEELRKSVLGCIAVIKTSEIHIQAVKIVKEKMRREITCPQSGNLDDIAELVEAEVRRLCEEQGDADLENHPEFVNNWKNKIEGTARANINVGDGIEIVNDNVLSGKCPLSAKPYSELTDPVRNTGCRHIYERAAVLGYLGRKSSIPCPVAGCRATVSKRSIVRDEALVDEIEFAKRSQRQSLDNEARRNAGFLDLAEDDE